MQRHKRSDLCMAVLACLGDALYCANVLCPGRKGKDGARPSFPPVELQAGYIIKLSGG